MTHGKQLVRGLSALTIVFGMHAHATSVAENSTPFRIMSEQEITAHNAAMNSLRGQAREDYRNAQYAQLKARARANGYRLPEAPPWAGSAGAQSPATSAAANPAANDAAARHNELRAKLQARQQSLPVTTPPVAGAVTQATTAVEPTPANAATQVATDAVQTASAAAPIEQHADTPANQADTQPAGPSDAPGTVAADGQETAEVAQGKAPPTPVVPGLIADENTLNRALNSDSSVTTHAPIEAPTAPQPPARPDPVDTTAFTPIDPPRPPEPPALPEPPAKPSMAKPGDDTDASHAAAATAPAAASTQEAMNKYRENMRARFDAYMKERQAQHEEAMRLQREQRAAAHEQGRAMQNQRAPYQPFAVPNPPVYGPRYPAAFPGYRTPYWQQR